MDTIYCNNLYNDVDDEMIFFSNIMDLSIGLIRKRALATIENSFGKILVNSLTTREKTNRWYIFL
jgi:hypothetical protein